MWTSTHTEGRNYETQRNKSCNNKKTVIEVVQILNDDKLLETKNESVANEAWKCSKCDKTFLTSINSSEHMETHKEEIKQRITWNVCDIMGN